MASVKAEKASLHSKGFVMQRISSSRLSVLQVLVQARGDSTTWSASSSSSSSPSHFQIPLPTSLGAAGPLTQTESLSLLEESRRNERQGSNNGYWRALFCASVTCGALSCQGACWAQFSLDTESTFAGGVEWQNGHHGFFDTKALRLGLLKSGRRNRNFRGGARAAARL